MTRTLIPEALAVRDSLAVTHGRLEAPDVSSLALALGANDSAYVRFLVPCWQILANRCWVDQAARPAGPMWAVYDFLGPILPKLALNLMTSHSTRRHCNDRQCNMPEALPAEKQLSVRSLWDQGREVDCCLSCALAICFEALELTGPELAPLYHYWWARPDRTVATPLKLTAAFGVTQMKGFCQLPLHEYPLTPAGALIQPSPSANDDAKDRRLGFDMETGEPLRKWLSRWDAVRRWKQALVGNFPILIGLALDDDYWAMQGGQRSRWEPAGQAIGSVGHAVAVTGYSDTNEVFTIQDSRGKGFGEQGRWHLPYAHARANKIVAAYVIGTAE